MNQKLEFLNEIFERDLSEDDLSRDVKATLEWDSFHIMNFMVMSEERFHKRINIEDLAEVRYICDLINLLEKNRRT